MTNLTCHLFGHDAHTVQSRDIITILSPDHVYWPGAVTYCRRCGLIFKNVAGSPTKVDLTINKIEWDR